MRRSLPLLTLLMTPWLLAATECGRGEDSASVSQDRVYVAYWVYFDANAGRTYARAKFTFGNALGTVLELSGPSKVTFNGQPMAFVPGWAWYEAVLSGEQSGTFEYTNNDGALVSVKADAATPVGFSEASYTFTRGTAPTITFTGTPLARGESLEVVVASAANRLDFASFLQTAEGASTIVLDASRLERFTGQGVLTVRRHRELKAIGTSAGSTLKLTFQPRDVPVQFAP